MAGNGQVASRGRGVVESGQRVLDLADEVRDRVGEIDRRLQALVRRRPAAAVLLALGVGFLVGRIARW